MKRTFMILFLLLALSLSLACPVLASADGFSSDAVAMNAAAQSVYKLEAYRNGTLFATGSGSVAFDRNLIVTNYHVIEGADTMVAISDNGDRFEIRQLLAADKTLDYALLVFPQGGEPLPVATSDPMRGTRCVAIGSPRGMKNSFSDGMISGMYTDDETGITYIQFNAPISSGSSGGALFNDNGELIGMPTFVLVDSRNSATQNMNYAVRIQDVAAEYTRHRSDSPVALSEAYRVADPSYRDNYKPGEIIVFDDSAANDLGVLVDDQFKYSSFSRSINLDRGDAKVRITAFDAENLGAVSKGVGLLNRFVNTTDYALRFMCEAYFERDFSKDDLLHPELSGGFQCSMIPAFRTEYDGMEKNVCMAIVFEDTTYLQLLATSPSGTASDLESVMALALNRLVALG